MRHSPLLLLSLSLTAVLFAQGPPAHAKREPETDQREYVLRMAKRYNVAPELIEKIRSAGIDLGEVEVIVDMAKAAKKKPDEIIALRKKGTLWPKIAESYGLDLEDIVKDEEARNALIEGDKNLLKQLTERFKLKEEQVLAYRARVADWGEVHVALLISEKSGVAVEKLIEKVNGEHGWGVIANDLGIDVGKLMREAKRGNKKSGEDEEEENEHHQR